MDDLRITAVTKTDRGSGKQVCLERNLCPFNLEIPKHGEVRTEKSDRSDESECPFEKLFMDVRKEEDTTRP
jgi:hypothetical protein